MRNHPPRKISTEDINKRLSLPADIRLPEGYLEKLTLNSPIFDKPLSRRLRRVSLSEIGFGKLETYIKLDKLGEVPMPLSTKAKASSQTTLWHSRRSDWNTKRGHPAPPSGKCPCSRTSNTPTSSRYMTLFTRRSPSPLSLSTWTRT